MRVTIVAVLLWSLTCTAFAAEIDVDVAIERPGLSANVWESRGSILIHPRGSDMMEVVDDQGGSRWLDVSSLVAGTISVETAARIDDRYLVSGILGNVDRQMSLGFLIFDSSGKLVEEHGLGLIGEHGRRIYGGDAIHIMSAHDIGGGLVALFWSGHRGAGSPRQQGVSLFDGSTWKLVRDVYGPVDLPTHAQGDVNFRRKLCGIRMAGDQLVVVDAHTARLVLVPLSGDDEPKVLDLTDDNGDKAAIIGWWISPAADGVEILYLNTEQDEVQRRVVSYRLNGDEQGRRPLTTPLRLVLPTDTRQALVFRGTGTIEKVRIH